VLPFVSMMPFTLAMLSLVFADSYAFLSFVHQVRTSIKVPAIHILQSIHSPAPYPTPLHPSHDFLSAPTTSSSATSPIKPDVRARLQDIEGRTGARIDVRMVKQEKAMYGEGREVGQQVKQPSVKPFPWTQQSSNPPTTSPPILSQPGVAISDSARSKSMYPFLPAHQMPQVAEHDGNGHQGEEIQRTDSPECIASPESVGALLPPDASHPTAMESPNPWNPRSKTIDVPRPRIAGLKSPLSPCSASLIMLSRRAWRMKL
jgi:hypothetical protein